MYIQTYNGRIVRVSDEQMLEDDMQMDLPSDFDYDHIDSYEVVDGVLIKHEIEEDNAPTAEERIAELEAALELLLSGVTE